MIVGMNKTRVAYYKLLKKTITNWKKYDLAREGESFTARYEELKAYVEAWKGVERPLIRSKSMSLSQLQMQVGKAIYEAWAKGKEVKVLMNEISKRAEKIKKEVLL